MAIIRTRQRINSLRNVNTSRIPYISSIFSDDKFSNVTLLLSGNGTNGAQNNTFLDSSSNAFSITRNGNPTQGTFSPFSQTGWSNYFNSATPDYLSLPFDSINVGANDFTAEAWVYVPDRSAIYTVFNGQTNASTASGSSYGMTIQDTTGYLQAAWYVGGGTYTLTGSNAVPLNIWNHVAFSRTAGNVSIFLNGTREATRSDMGTNTINDGSASYQPYIGRNGAYYAMKGYISNFRLIRGNNGYNATSSTITVPTSPLSVVANTLVLACQSNGFRDANTSPKTITVNGTPSVQAFSPFAPTVEYRVADVGGSGYFDGTGDYLQTATTTSFAFGTGNFTIEGWVYLTAYNSGASLFGTTQGATTGYYVNLGGDVNSLRVTSNASGTWTDNITVSAGNGVRLNEWTHIALVRNAGSLILYKNGVNVASTSSAASWNFTSPNNAGYIGRVTNGVSTQDLAGWVTSVRVSNTARTITVPTTPYSSDANTVLLTNFTNAGITDATAKNVLETVGNAQISTTQSKFGGSSMSFDGTGDYLTFPASQNWVFGTGDFTIEFWVYANSLASTAIFVECRNNTVGPVIFYDSGALRVNFNSIGGVLITGGALSTTTWYHIALARSGSSTRLFVNGTQSGSTATDTNNYSNDTLIVGASYLATQTLNGYIDDLRITKGVARYTGNFSVPEAEFYVK